MRQVFLGERRAFWFQCGLLKDTEGYNRYLLLALVLVTLLKVVIATNTIGSNDVVIYWKLGSMIGSEGLLETYRSTAAMNHPPAIGMALKTLHAASGSERELFAFLVRFVGIAGDFVLGCLVIFSLRKAGAEMSPGWGRQLLLIASPVAVMVSGFHGNTDPLLALLMFWSVYFGWKNSPALSGTLFALACQIKVVPLLILPILLLHWWDRGLLRRFLVPAVTLIVLGYLPILLQEPIVLGRIVGYSGIQGIWGFPMWLRLTNLPAFAPLTFTELTVAQQVVTTVLKAVVVIAVTWMAWVRRREPAVEMFTKCGLAFMIFFFLAPSAAPQYMVWPLPFLLFMSRGVQVAWTASAAAFLFFFYNTICGGLPWYFGDSTRDLVPLWVTWTLLPWAAAGAAAWYGIKQRGSTPPAAGALLG